MRCVEQGQVDGFLQIEAMMDAAQEQRQLPLLLLVTTRRSKYKAWLAVFKGGETGERGARAAGLVLTMWGGLLPARNICARVLSGKPSAGMTGEDCSQPPEGVAAIMLPS